MTYDDKGETKTIECDRVLVAVGRTPMTDGLGLDKIGITPNRRGSIEVDEHFRTPIAGVWAIGDVIPGPMLAHLAEHEAICAVETMAGHSTTSAEGSVERWRREPVPAEVADFFARHLHEALAALGYEIASTTPAVGIDFAASDNPLSLPRPLSTPRYPHAFLPIPVLLKSH